MAIGVGGHPKTLELTGGIFRDAAPAGVIRADYGRKFCNRPPQPPNWNRAWPTLVPYPTGGETKAKFNTLGSSCPLTARRCVHSKAVKLSRPCTRSRRKVKVEENGAVQSLRDTDAVSSPESRLGLGFLGRSPAISAGVRLYAERHCRPSKRA
jgi:hypothetical protein